MDDAVRDRLVAGALNEVAAGRARGLETLYELLGGSVYRLSEAVTGDRTAAERATVETFTEVWRQLPDHVCADSASAWILDLACSIACRTRPVVRSDRPQREDASVVAGLAPVGHGGVPGGGSRVSGRRSPGRG
jgi:DNA-directed RNA polymerase specialized sigma24 family protein